MSIEAMFAIIVVAMFSTMGFASYNNSQEKIECFKAMQYNPKLTCGNK